MLLQMAGGQPTRRRAAAADDLLARLTLDVAL